MTIPYNLIKKKSRFSLIELLVVITILSILISLFIPAIDRVFFNVHLAECQSNMKGLYKGFNMYADDNDDYYPRNTAERRRAYDLGNNWGGQSIYSMITPYFSNIGKNFMCPAARANPKYDGDNKIVDYNKPNRTDNDKIVAGYFMFFGTSDGQSNSIWKQDQYQMHRVGDTFSFKPEHEGGAPPYYTYDILISDLNVDGGAHIAPWAFRQNMNVGDAYTWKGYEVQNNYLFIDGSIRFVYTYFPPNLYHDMWRKRGQVAKIFSKPNNNSSNRLFFPKELIYYTGN